MPEHERKSHIAQLHRFADSLRELQQQADAARAEDRLEMDPEWEYAYSALSRSLGEAALTAEGLARVPELTSS